MQRFSVLSVLLLPTQTRRGHGVLLYAKGIAPSVPTQTDDVMLQEGWDGLWEDRLVWWWWWKYCIQFLY